MNLVVYVMFAFMTWPLEQENAALRARLANQRQQPPTAPGAYGLPPFLAAHQPPAPAAGSGTATGWAGGPPGEQPSSQTPGWPPTNS